MKQEELKYWLDPNDITDEMILKRCRCPRDAIRLTRDCSPLTDKEIIAYIKKRTQYEYQQSHFTEALSVGGRKNFDPDHVPILEEACENRIYTRYVALSRNCILKPRKDAYELALEAATAKYDQLNTKYEALLEAISVKGTVVQR